MEHVLGLINDEDKQLLNDGTQKAKLAIEEILKNGIDIAMNKYN